jgi:hypothetical protein
MTDNAEEQKIDVTEELSAKPVQGIKSDEDYDFQNKYGFNITYDPEKDNFRIGQYMYSYGYDDTDGEYKHIYVSKELDKDSRKLGDKHLSLTGNVYITNTMKPYNYDYTYYHDELLLPSRLDISKSLRHNQTTIPVNVHVDDYYDYIEHNIEDEDRTIYEGVQGYYNSSGVHINVPGMSLENYEKYIDEYNPSAEILEKVINFISKYSSFTEIQSSYEHEMTHAMDDRFHGINQYDLPPQYMTKLNMLTEIRANLTQAGLAFDMYKATGNMEYFKLGTIDMTEVKETLQQNPNMENPEGYIADYVYKHWLEKYNRTGSIYSKQAENFGFSYTAFALDDTQDSLNRYYDRVGSMFEHIEGLGDVRKYVNPDFELNDDLHSMTKGFGALGNSKGPYIINDNLKAMMKNNANNAEAYSKNLMAYLELVKKVDSDGYRTDAERAELDKYMQEHMAPQNNTTNNVTNTYQSRINSDTDEAVITDSSSAKDLKALMKAGIHNAENYNQSLQSYMNLSKQLDALGVSEEDKKIQLQAYVDAHITPKQNDVAIKDKTQNADVAQAEKEKNNLLIMRNALNQNVK